ncbi:OmpA family protein [Sulfurimonas paralvinellae]|uniref:OmpA family protein n=1 Tax=Sulfurimonas paralvinellae TaxID=317658 RepID=A0A7M1B614_9BACT|nr:OmpA family protein [Sulfurimonas paralvinellae]QOP45167.1 OmpA family protein [Sulfurimonas paralvinellae]
MKRLVYIFIGLITSTFVYASVSHTLDDTFFEKEFQQIIRFEMLHFNDENSLDEKSIETLDAAIVKIKELQKSSKIKVTLVGHAYKAADYYPQKMQNNLGYVNESSKNDDNRSENYVKAIEKKLIDKGIDRSSLYIYDKEGQLPAFTDEIPESGSLSNRVMLSIYVLKPEDIDSDRDGVFDRYDRCPGTPRGSKVDKNGCPIDSDHDGVLDYKDKCPDTPPKGVLVDSHGCPLDSDHDGVVDYKDKCENTPEGIRVDPFGCPLKQTLKLHFKSNSAKILKNSYGEIQKFAEFLKKNPGYKVKITGHTDSIGKAVVNMQLSLQRAKSVKKALVAEGIDASRIVTAGRGELDPIESNRTAEGRKANRRIEIKLFH